MHLRTTRYAEIVEDRNIIQNTVILKDEGKKEIRDERRGEGRGGEIVGEDVVREQIQKNDNIQIRMYLIL